MRDEYALARPSPLSPVAVPASPHDPNDEAAIDAAPPPRATQLHPATGETVGVIAEAFHPARALR